MAHLVKQISASLHLNYDITRDFRGDRPELRKINHLLGISSMVEYDKK